MNDDHELPDGMANTMRAEVLDHLDEARLNLREIATCMLDRGDHTLLSEAADALARLDDASDTLVKIVGDEVDLHAGLIPNSPDEA